jgi:hypothetical protein
VNWVARYLAILESRELLKREKWEHRITVERETLALRSDVKAIRLVAAIPDDLEAFVMQESEKWARDELREDIRARYVEYGDWNKVRAAIGIGALENAS